MAIGSIFLGTLVLSFSATLLLAGLFGAYYGHGRSRALGFSLAVLAVVFLGVFAALTFAVVPGLKPIFDADAMARSAAAVGAGLVGASVAIGVFLAVINRG